MGKGSCDTLAFSDSLGLTETPPPDFVPLENPPKAIRSAKPAYPQAILNSLKGQYRICVCAWVSETGAVRQARISNCIPNELIPYVVEAVRSWSFEPGTVGNQAKATWIVVQLRYPAD
jgi:outer membrane biosynthesis protein TonB